MCTECQVFYLGGFSSGWFKYGIIQGGFFKWCRNVLFKGEFIYWFNKRYLRCINTPFIGDFTTSLAHNHHGCHVIRIKGKLLEINGRFDINLQDNYSLIEPANYVHRRALQISVRPNDEDSYSFVLNTFKRRWGTDETIEGISFRPGALFEIDIVCESDAFQIYLERQYLYSYKHRVPIEQVKQLSIDGDVKLDKIGWQKPCESTDYPFCSTRTTIQIKKLLPILDSVLDISQNIFFIFVILGIISYRKHGSLVILRRIGSFAAEPFVHFNNAVNSIIKWLTSS